MTESSKNEFAIELAKRKLEESLRKAVKNRMFGRVSLELNIRDGNIGNVALTPTEQFDIERESTRAVKENG